MLGWGYSSEEEAKLSSKEEDVLKKAHEALNDPQVYMNPSRIVERTNQIPTTLAAGDRGTGDKAYFVWRLRDEAQTLKVKDIHGNYAEVQPSKDARRRMATKLENLAEALEKTS